MQALRKLAHAKNKDFFRLKNNNNKKKNENFIEKFDFLSLLFKTLIVGKR